MVFWLVGASSRHACTDIHRSGRAIVTTLRWESLPQYQGRLIYGVAITLALLVSSCAAGFLIAMLLGLALVVGAKAARVRGPRFLRCHSRHASASPDLAALLWGRLYSC